MGDRRAIDSRKRVYVSTGKTLERLKTGPGKARTRSITVGYSQKIANGILVVTRKTGWPLKVIAPADSWIGILSASP